MHGIRAVSLSHPFFGQGPGALWIGNIINIWGNCMGKKCTPFKQRTKLIFSFKCTAIFKIQCSLFFKSFDFLIALKNWFSHIVLTLKCKCNWEFFKVQLGKYINFCHWEWSQLSAPIWGKVAALMEPFKHS